MPLLEAIIVNTVGGAVLATGGIAAPLVAPLLGFSAKGIVAGSLAAGAQSYYGDLVAGCVISKMTSMTMLAGGASASIVSFPVLGLAAVGGVAAIYGRGGNLTDTLTTGSYYGKLAAGSILSGMTWITGVDLRETLVTGSQYVSQAAACTLPKLTAVTGGNLGDALAAGTYYGKLAGNYVASNMPSITGINLSGTVATGSYYGNLAYGCLTSKITSITMVAAGVPSALKGWVPKAPGGDLPQK